LKVESFFAHLNFQRLTSNFQLSTVEIT